MGTEAPGDHRPPGEIPEAERDYYLERKYPSFGNLSPRDIASRAAKEVCDEGRGVGPGGLGVYLDFADAIQRLGESTIAERYGNLFEMYERITDENPYRVPMRIYPAVHYTMGGLWVDYNLMSTIPGLHVLGEANFSDHGANRLGASALMQGLADGYFVIPYTIGHYLATSPLEPVSADHPEVAAAEAEVAQRVQRLLGTRGRRTVQSFHRELGTLMWDKCGMARDAAGLESALQEIPALREEFWRSVNVPGSGTELNQSLEYAGRVADFLELAELMCRDALHREESCGGHFRTEHQTADGEARARRRALLLRRRVGVRRRRAPATPPGAAGVRERPPRDQELQVTAVEAARMNLTLRVWRQAGPDAPGRFVQYDVRDVSPDMSFLEMLDVVNEGLTEKGEEPIAFDSDCREGICGMCGVMINGVAHGPMKGTATCQLHLRSFPDGATITVEPWRARAFPLLRDLCVDRQRAGPHHPGRRVRLRQHRQRAGCQRAAYFQGGRRPGHGRSRVHRLRRLRGRVPERVGVAVHGGQDITPRHPASGPARTATPCPGNGGADGSGALRQLHPVWRVPGGLPEGDLDRRHRAHEPRLLDRDAVLAARDGLDVASRLTAVPGPPRSTHAP